MSVILSFKRRSASVVAGNPCCMKTPTEICCEEVFYDALAPYFQEYCRTKARYLAAVDRLVTSSIIHGAASLLDVGAGDGLRGVRLASACGVRALVLAEPSAMMADHCRQHKGADVWQSAAEELPETGSRFEVVTCLWNVLGHIADRERRLVALQKMRSLLTDNGQLFIDVHNRYNARAYGWFLTTGRFLYDLARPSPQNGDVEFSWSVGGKTISARGHVFTPREVEKLFKEAGVKIERRVVVDYGTGRLRRLPFSGQLFYELRKA